MDRSGGITVPRVQAEIARAIASSSIPVGLQAPTVQDLSAIPNVLPGTLGLVTGTGRMYRAVFSDAAGSVWDPVDGNLFLTDFGAVVGGNANVALTDILVYAQTTLPSFDLWREIVIPGGDYFFSTTLNIYNPITIRG